MSSWSPPSGSEPNPPHWDTKHVKIIDPNDSRGGQSAVDAIWNEMQGNDRG